MSGSWSRNVPGNAKFIEINYFAQRQAAKRYLIRRFGMLRAKIAVAMRLPLQ
jgi:hypothetical protein